METSYQNGKHQEILWKLDFKMVKVRNSIGGDGTPPSSRHAFWPMQ